VVVEIGDVPGEDDRIEVEAAAELLVGLQHFGGTETAHGKVQDLDPHAALRKALLEPIGKPIADVDFETEQERIAEYADAARAGGLGERIVLIGAPAPRVDSVVHFS